MKTSTLLTIHGYSEERVKEVMKEMKQIGSPTIRIVDCGDHYIAIEGTHRIEAARRLKQSINWIILNENSEVSANTLDTNYFIKDEVYTAGEIAEEIYSNNNGCYEIDENEIIDIMFNGKIIK